jgi:acetylornithine/succinyldiaminopimelate/putrescine aminotransferase
VAVKALEIYQREQPWHNAAAVGERLRTRLAALIPSTPLVSVAGRGLLLSLALGSPEEAQALCRHATGHGVLVMPGRVATHTVLLRPSLLIDETEATAISDAMGRSLHDLAGS